MKRAGCVCREKRQWPNAISKWEAAPPKAAPVVVAVLPTAARNIRSTAVNANIEATGAVATTVEVTAAAPVVANGEVVTVVAIADPEAANAPTEEATVAARHRTAAK